MHGAAQSPNAAPSSAAEPVLLALCDEPRGGQTVEIGQREQPHHREAEHDHDEARDGEEQLAVVQEEAAGRRDRGAQRDEHRREAGHERQAREHDAAPSHARLLARHHGEVAGDERQHARGREGDEAGDEGERDLGLHRASQPS